jgi:hypothetical protein
MHRENTIANLDDFAAVCVCFHEHLISYLFADLLEARGVPTKILRHLEESTLIEKVITEPQYVSVLSETQRRQCLVVGTAESLTPFIELGTHLLSRPLSEEKIDLALNQLFRE